MEGSAVDKILKQLLWELGGYQAPEFQIVNTEKEERGKSDGVCGEKLGDSDRVRDEKQGDNDRVRGPKRDVSGQDQEVS